MRWIISAVVVLALVAGLWWMEQRQQAELAPEPGLDLPESAEKPEPRYPLPEPEPQPEQAPTETPDTSERSEPEDQPEPEPRAPLPTLAESDSAVVDELGDLVGSEWVQRWIRPEFVISRTVAIVNSLDGDAPALKTRPLSTLDTEPVTRQTDTGDTLLWTEANAERYAGLIAALDSVTPKEAAQRYGRYYPLFQQAWEELGEPEPYFNDRLIDVVDHLLATPDIKPPIPVTPYEGRLIFSDPALEELSWGRKVLVRMGPSHANIVKNWLRAFRRNVTDSNGSRPAGSEQQDGRG